VSGVTATMRKTANKAKEAQANRPDPRLAAFVRLLARDLASQHFAASMDREPVKAHPVRAEEDDLAEERP
jgi:hypothetical protein